MLKYKYPQLNASRYYLSLYLHISNMHIWYGKIDNWKDSLDYKGNLEYIT